MITIQKRHEVVTHRILGKSERKVAEELGMSRNTVRKYWKDYLHTRNKLNQAQSESQRLECRLPTKLVVMAILTGRS